MNQRSTKTTGSGMRTAALMALTATVLAACCGVEIPRYVAIPEQIFREPAIGHIDLGKIDVENDATWPAAKASLLAFLKAGGNQDNVEDGTMVTPDAELRFEPLLAAIAQSANRDVADLTNYTYADWFSQPPLRHVVDARREAPQRDQYALADGDYWWIFSAKRQRLVGLTVVRRHDWQRTE